MRSAVISINGSGLEFDRDYGIDKQTGWTAVHEGRVLSPQFGTLWQALAALWRAWRSADEP